MPGPTYATVDAYLDAQPAPARRILDQVRAAIRQALPDAEEVISYKIPAYRNAHGTVIFFAGWKKHFSLYPITEAILARVSEPVASCKVEKGTIRFPLAEPVPVELIAEIARLRAREAAAESARKTIKVGGKRAAAGLRA